MAYVGLRFEDCLDGASNFFSWREIIGVVFEQGVWEFVDNPHSNKSLIVGPT
jgi:hypothetical protein